MDVLLSIPLISAVLTPSVSTSINILFFYATWSTLLLTHNYNTIHASSLLVLRVIFWLIPSLIFLAFDYLIPSISGSIKFTGAASLPKRPWRLILLATANMLLVTAVEAAISFGIFWFSGKTFYKPYSTLPLPFQVFKHCCILFTSRELLSYYIHRFLLHEGKSKTLTRLHTSYAHANPTCAIQLYADHPLPLLILHVIPVFIPAAIVRPHLLTYLLFVLLTTAEGTLTTSGYSIVPGIFLGGIARRTAIHYASKGKGNYGAWGVLDWAHGTSKGRDVFEDAKAEAEKHELKERGEEKASEGAGLLQDGMDAIKESTGTRRSNRKRTPTKKD